MGWAVRSVVKRKKFCSLKNLKNIRGNIVIKSISIYSTRFGKLGCNRRLNVKMGKSQEVRRR
jgi:hypothetical protein